MHPLHGNPYSLTSISIDGHLHSLLISHVNVRLSYFLSSLITPNIICYSTYSAISMACAHVLREGWKGWSALKSMNQLLGLSSGLCMMGDFVWRKSSMAKLYDFVGISFFRYAILIRHDYLLVCLKYYYFYVNMNFYFESFGSEHSCQNKENYVEKYAR